MQATYLKKAKPVLEADVKALRQGVEEIIDTVRKDGDGALAHYAKTAFDIEYEFPLSEVIFDFFDKLKSVSRGYASLDYEFAGYREAKLVKLDILINGEPLDALSTIVHKDRAFDQGKALCTKLRKLIPRQMFEVVIQASIGHKVIARESVQALRKNVLSKCYGGDVTRKRKLLLHPSFSLLLSLSKSSSTELRQVI